MNIYRQGDILLRERKDHLFDATIQVGYEVWLRNRPRKHLVVAIGEGEGHAHTLHAPSIRAWSDANGRPKAVEIEGGVGVLDHPEHGKVEVAPGTYDVVREREENLQGHAYDTVD